MLQAPLWLWLLQILMLPARLTGSWESASREEDLASEHGSSWGMSLTIKVRVHLGLFLSLSSCFYWSSSHLFVCFSLSFSTSFSFFDFCLFAFVQDLTLPHSNWLYTLHCISVCTGAFWKMLLSKCIQCTIVIGEIHLP